MDKSVKIKVRNIGQNFAHDAVVKQGDKVLHTTRETPYGMGHVAYALAESWAKKNGYSVRS